MKLSRNPGSLPDARLERRLERVLDPTHPGLVARPQ